jgi:hypothetical protein
MGRLRIPIIFLICCSPAVGPFAQISGNFAPPENAPVVRAIRATGKVQLDGSLNESDWQRAPVIDDFFRMEPRQGGPVSNRTTVRVLFDERNLYVGAVCYDSLGREGIRVQDLRRDFIYGENDIFYLQLDPQNLRQYCVSFQTTPYGNQRDAQIFNDDRPDNDWNSLWKVRTQRSDSGYVAEFAIPFKSLRYDRPEAGQPVSWGITFARLARREYEQTVFPAVPQSFTPYRMTYAARLEGLELPPPGANVRVEPYALYQYERAANDVVGTNLKVGGDVKWAVTPRAVVDLTVNTDFAQADVDLAVNNLERFNIFFPERRQFFLENAGIYAGANSTAVRPFFSRTIGLQGNFDAAPAPLDAGVRYTMRSEQRALAGLYIHQRETERSPGASFGVLRYLHNYGRENNVGLMVTHRRDERATDLGLETASDNTTLTLDGQIRPRSEWTTRYLLSASRDDATDEIGLAGTLFSGYQSNKFYAGWLTNFVGREYRPDMGFVFQRNVIAHNPGGYLILRPKKLPWIRRFDPGVFVNYNHDATDPGNFQQASLYLFPLYLILTNGSYFEYAILPTWQRINFDFAPLGLRIPLGDYYYTRQRIRGNTDQSAKFSVSGSLDWGGFYNGRRTTVTGGLRYAPSVHAALTFDYEHNDLRRVGEDRQQLSTNLYTGGVRLALNPRLQLSVLYQYNSFDGQGRWNVRGSWEYYPLSFVYLVFNDRRIDPFMPDRFGEQQVIAKGTLVRQF